MNGRTERYAHYFGLAARKNAKPTSTPTKPQGKPKVAPTKPKAKTPDFSHLRRAAPAPVPLTPAQRCDRRGDAARAGLPAPGTIERPGPRQTAPAVANPDRLAAEIIAAGKRRRGEA